MVLELLFEAAGAAKSSRYREDPGCSALVRDEVIRRPGIAREARDSLRSRSPCHISELGNKLGGSRTGPRLRDPRVVAGGPLRSGSAVDERVSQN